MRSRWREWVLSVALVAISLGGIGLIWGDDIARLFRAPDAGLRPPPTITPAPRPRDAPVPERSTSPRGATQTL